MKVVNPEGGEVELLMIPLDICGGGERCGAVLTNEDIVYHSGIPIVIRGRIWGRKAKACVGV